MSKNKKQDVSVRGLVAQRDDISYRLAEYVKQFFGHIDRETKELVSGQALYTVIWWDSSALELRWNNLIYLNLLDAREEMDKLVERGVIACVLVLQQSVNGRRWMDFEYGRPLTEILGQRYGLPLYGYTSQEKTK